MISKKAFVKAMKEITKHDDFETAINKVFSVITTMIHLS